MGYRAKTDELLAILNEARGFKSRDIGFSFFADIKGDGRDIRSVYTVINAGGGVTYSHMNAGSPKGRIQRIQAEIDKVTAA